MKRSKGRFYVLVPVVLAIGMYMVFYSKITCTPGDAGFWLIIVMGMSIGAALTRFIQL